MTSTLTADARDFSELLIASFEIQDKTENKIATRTAKRIMDKGFEILHILDGFNKVSTHPYGRSSCFKQKVIQYEIGFCDDEGKEYALFVRQTKVVSIDRRNPYDRTPPSTKAGVEFLTTKRETLKVLGMKEPE